MPFQNSPAAAAQLAFLNHNLQQTEGGSDTVDIELSGFPWIRTQNDPGSTTQEISVGTINFGGSNGDSAFAAVITKLSNVFVIVGIDENELRFNHVITDRINSGDKINYLSYSNNIDPTISRSKVKYGITKARRIQKFAKKFSHQSMVELLSHIDTSALGTNFLAVIEEKDHRPREVDVRKVEFVQNRSPHPGVVLRDFLLLAYDLSPSHLRENGIPHIDLILAEKHSFDEVARTVLYEYIGGEADVMAGLQQVFDYERRTNRKHSGRWNVDASGMYVLASE